MATPAQPHRLHRTVVLITAFLTMLLSLLILAGWHIDRPMMARFLPSSLPAHPVSAINLLLSGAALAVIGFRRPRWRHIAVAASTTVLLVGLLQLLHIIAVSPLTVDLWLYRSRFAPESPFGSARMSPYTALNFVLVSLALLTLGIKTRMKPPPSRVFTLALFTLVIIPALGYAYTIEDLQQPTLNPIPLPTTLGFLLLAVGLFFARPDTNMTGFLTSSSTGGLLLRRLLPFMLGLPILLGGLGVSAVASGWLSPGLAFAFVAAVTMTIGMVLLGRYAITLHHIEQVIRDASWRFESLTNSTPDAIITRALDDTVLTWNRAAEELYGYQAEEMIGETFAALIPFECRQQDQTLLDAILQGGQATNVHTERLRKDGSRALVSVSYAPLVSQDGVIVGVSNIARDISGEMEAQRKLRESLAYEQALTQVMALLEQHLEVEEAARLVTRVIGPVLKAGWAGLVMRPDAELAYHTLWRNEHAPPSFPERGVLQRAAILATLEAQTPLFVEKDMHPDLTPDGFTSGAFLPLHDGAGGSRTLLSVCRFGDVGAWSSRDRELIEAAARSINVALERAEHVRELELAALEDQLTGLRNRRAFELDTQAEVARAKRQHSSFGVMILDLDGLKRVNDTQGHDYGDRLLRTFGQALAASVRASDLVYRLGGDEFAVLLIGAGHGARDITMQKVQGALARVRTEGFAEVGVSMGASFYPDDGEAVSTLVRAADDRMYDMKRSRKNPPEPE